MEAVAASIAIGAFAVRIVGHPTVEQWGEAFGKALDLGATATWARTDLIGWAEDENPFGDEHMQFIQARKVSHRTLRNDKRRYNRFPPDHDLRRLVADLSPSHFDAAAPLGDIDAEQVLLEAVKEDLGRDWVRERAREIQNNPAPVVFDAELIYDAANRVFVPTVEPPDWIVQGELFKTRLKKAA